MYCEDPRLEIRAPGQMFWAVDLKKLKEPPAAMEQEEVSWLIDTIGACLDFQSHPGTSPGVKALKWKFENSSRVAAVRAHFARL
jgi:hypothetical protein